MKSTKISLTLILILIIKFSVIGQTEEEQLVSITVSGSGKTLNEAKKSAHRSAIEQAFGTFISSKTEILNDDVISDQITSVASGNIVSFEILNESQIPTGGFISTLKAIVSVNKLTSFVEAKWVAIEIKGGVRNGNTKTFDLLTGELIEKKKYKNGVVED
jgi:hypothetical protein